MLQFKGHFHGFAHAQSLLKKQLSTSLNSHCSDTNLNFRQVNGTGGLFRGRSSWIVLINSVTNRVFSDVPGQNTEPGQT